MTAPNQQQYRLVCTDRRGGVVGELNDAVLTSAVWELNNPGSLKYNLQQNSPNILVPLEHQNEVQLWINGQLRHWAFHEDTSESAHTAEFTCPGLLAYMRGRFITNTSLYYGYGTDHQPLPPGVDQLDIAADIITKKAYDWNIGVYPYDKSGVMRYRFYDIFSHQNILDDILSAFPQLQDSLGNYTGFDYDIVYDSSGRRYFRMYYPSKGSTLTDVSLEFGRNITDYTNAVRGCYQENEVYYTGGSNGDIKFENHAIATDAERAPYGTWESVQSQGDENDLNTLLELAQNRVAKRKRPQQFPDIQAVEVPDSLLGVINPGDRVPVKIVNGRTNINTTYRVQSIEWLPGPGNLKIKFIDPADQADPVTPGTWRARPQTEQWIDVPSTTTWNTFGVS